MKLKVRLCDIGFYELSISRMLIVGVKTLANLDAQFQWDNLQLHQKT